MPLRRVHSIREVRWRVKTGVDQGCVKVLSQPEAELGRSHRHIDHGGQYVEMHRRSRQTASHACRQQRRESPKRQRTDREGRRNHGPDRRWVQRVSGLIEQTSSATREQADGISQVDTAITQLDQTTQQNAALVEESAAAAASLKQQAVVCCSLEATSEWSGSEWPINHVHNPGEKPGGFLAPVKQVAPHWT